MKILFHLHVYVQTKLYWYINTRACMTENGRTKIKKQHFVIHNPISGDNITETVFIMSIIRFKTKHSFFMLMRMVEMNFWLSNWEVLVFTPIHALNVYCFQSKNILPQNIYLKCRTSKRIWCLLTRHSPDMHEYCAKNHEQSQQRWTIPFCRVTYMVSEKMCEGKIECKWMDRLVGWLAYRPTRAERHIV